MSSTDSSEESVDVAPSGSGSAFSSPASPSAWLAAFFFFLGSRAASFSLERAARLRGQPSRRACSR
jgi:hypothetical protein